MYRGVYIQFLNHMRSLSEGHFLLSTEVGGTWSDSQRSLLAEAQQHCELPELPGHVTGWEASMELMVFGVSGS